MYLFIDTHPSFDTLHSAWQASAEKLKSALKPIGQTRLLTAGTQIPGSSEAKTFYRIESGGLKFTHEQKLLAVFEQGDLICGEAWLFDPNFALLAEFATACLELALDPTHSQDVSAAYEQHLLLSQQISLGLLASNLPKEGDAQPQLSFYKAGETVITQGDLSTEVFNLVDGHAEVFVDGIKVGEVLPDEIFGAIAAFCSAPRSASVVTTKDSMVLKLQADDFMKMVNARPNSVIKLIKDLSRALTSLNTKVVSSR